MALDSGLSTDALAVLIVLDEASEKDGRVEVASAATKLVMDRSELERSLDELEQRRLVRPIGVEGWYRMTDQGRQRLAPGHPLPSVDTWATQDDAATVASPWRRWISRIRASAGRRGSP